MHRVIMKHQGRPLVFEVGPSCHRRQGTTGIVNIGFTAQRNIGLRTELRKPYPAAYNRRCVPPAEAEILSSLKIDDSMCLIVMRLTISLFHMPRWIQCALKVFVIFREMILHIWILCLLMAVQIRTCPPDLDGSGKNPGTVFGLKCYFRAVIDGKRRRMLNVKGVNVRRDRERIHE